jgi:hypothetical protein
VLISPALGEEQAELTTPQSPREMHVVRAVRQAYDKTRTTKLDGSVGLKPLGG